MDDQAERDPAQGTGRMRYRIALTLIDSGVGRARVTIFDCNSIAVDSGPMRRDPGSGLLVQDVLIRLPAALAMGHDLSDLADPQTGDQG